jgi:hypothetical protein
MSKRLIVCLAGILAILAAPAVFAQGTPNLGAAEVMQQGSSFMFDARVFEATEDQDTLDNAVYTPGFAAAVNEKVDFSILFSNIDVANESEDINSSQYSSTNALTVSRKVLAPALKWRINANDSYPALTLSVGADIVMDGYTVTSSGLNLGQYGYSDTYGFDDFIPAARLQLQWGKPGKFQFQVAGQVNVFDDEGRYVSSGSPEPSPEPKQYDTPQGPGTVVGVGGGVVWPWSKKLAVVGDFMGIVNGYNSHCTICGQAHRQANIWSAGLNYACKASLISLYATNSLAPTLVDSLMASPGEQTAVAARWSTTW